MAETVLKTKKTKKILIIDDEEDLLNDLTFLLDGLYQLITASGSQEGLELLEKTSPDLVILDIHMPAYLAQSDEDEGIEFLKRIKTGKWSKIPVIVLTKFDLEEVREKCSNFRPEAYFKKPPVVSLLKMEIEKLIERLIEKGDVNSTVKGGDAKL